MPKILKIPHPAIEINLLPASSAIQELAYLPHLFACEKEKINKMKSPKRRSEYIRRCFLFHKIFNYEPLCSDPSGMAKWPNQLNGSISHKSGHIAIALDRGKKWRSIGIDLESYKKVHSGLFDKICTTNERVTLLNESQHAATLATRIFSAKEAIYKCIFPIGRKFFYFHDAEVTHFQQNEMILTLLSDVSPLTPAGTCISVNFQDLSIDNDDYVMTSCKL